LCKLTTMVTQWRQKKKTQQLFLNVILRDPIDP
jgi:hypothetical protein